MGLFLVRGRLRGTERRIVAGVGHFMPRERPAAVVGAMGGLLAKST